MGLVPDTFAPLLANRERTRVRVTLGKPKGEMAMLRCKARGRAGARIALLRDVCGLALSLSRRPSALERWAMDQPRTLGRVWVLRPAYPDRQSPSGARTLPRCVCSLRSCYRF